MEYASSIWSPLASSTSINKLQVMQNAALRTATGCTQDTHIQHMHHYNTNRKHNIHHIPYTNIQHNSTLQGSKVQNPLSSTTPATQQHCHRPPKSHYNRQKKHVPYIYITYFYASSHERQYQNIAHTFTTHYQL